MTWLIMERSASPEGGSASPEYPESTKGMYVVILDIGYGIWRVFYRDVFLGYFDEKNIREKQIKAYSKLSVNPIL